MPLKRRALYVLGVLLIASVPLWMLWQIVHYDGREFAAFIATILILGSPMAIGAWLLSKADKMKER